MPQAQAPWPWVARVRDAGMEHGTESMAAAGKAADALSAGEALL